MTVAIVHDWMTTLGGGEKVVLTLAQAIGAEIVTTEAWETSGSTPAGSPTRRASGSRWRRSALLRERLVVVGEVQLR